MTKTKGQVTYKSGSYGVRGFYNRRFKQLYGSLSAKNKDKFKAMTLEKKKRIINGLIRKGKMI